MSEHNDLLSTTDAAEWAKRFCEIAKGLGHTDIDEGWMIGWFANAMAAQEMAMHKDGGFVPQLAVNGELAWLRGFAAAQGNDRLTEVADRIQELVHITYSNFQARGDQLEKAHKYADQLEVKLGMQDSPTPEPPQSPATSQEEGAEAEPVRPFATHLNASGVPHWEDMTAAEIEAFKANESTEQPE